jgi:hypothetical protein
MFERECPHLDLWGEPFVHLAVRARAAARGLDVANRIDGDPRREPIE